MFYGPASIKHDRDYCWAVKEQLAPFDEENARTCKKQVLPKRMRPRAFETAVKEIDAVFKQFGTARLGFEDVSHLEEEDEEEEERDADDTDEEDTEDEDYGMNNRKRKKSEKITSTSNANVHKKKTSAAATSKHKTKKQKTLMKNGLQCASNAAWMREKRTRREAVLFVVRENARGRTILSMLWKGLALCELRANDSMRHVRDVGARYVRHDAAEF